jgi:Rrf2 family protein
MISVTGGYALRILGHLAGRREEWLRGRAVAEATNIPANYLSKILNQLRKSGLVESRKGWGGGFRLKGRALGTPIATVLDRIEGPHEDARCIFELRACDASAPCPLHDRWERVRGAYREMTRAVTIADLRAVASTPSSRAAARRPARRR